MYIGPRRRLVASTACVKLSLARSEPSSKVCSKPGPEPPKAHSERLQVEPRRLRGGTDSRDDRRPAGSPPCRIGAGYGRRWPWSARATVGTGYGRHSPWSSLAMSSLAMVVTRHGRHSPWSSLAMVVTRHGRHSPRSVTRPRPALATVGPPHDGPLHDGRSAGPPGRTQEPKLLPRDLGGRHPQLAADAVRRQRLGQPQRPLVRLVARRRRQQLLGQLLVRFRPSVAQQLLERRRGRRRLDARLQQRVLARLPRRTAPPATARSGRRS